MLLLVCGIPYIAHSFRPRETTMRHALGHILTCCCIYIYTHTHTRHHLICIAKFRRDFITTPWASEEEGENIKKLRRNMRTRTRWKSLLLDLNKKVI